MRLIDADDMCEWCGESNPIKCSNCKAPQMETIDAVPVVRCKDCRYMNLLGPGYRYCLVWRGVNGLGDDGYCNYGERTVDNEHTTSDPGAADLCV